MNTVLEVNGLKKNYKSFSLKDVSFSLKEGCITGFIGINGAGKTTTIKSILGMISKDGGSIKLYGKELSEKKQELKNHIGIVLDEGYFYEDLTLNDMKSIIAPAYSNWDEKLFRKNMGRFDLDPKQKICDLSKGMKMKYSIALAISHHADLLIMDEPTSGLDPLVRSELMDMLLEFMEEENKSVLFSTHITSDLDKVADMLILIDSGEIIFSDEKDSLLDSHVLVKGDKKLLTDSTRKLFLMLNESSYSFEGISNKKSELKQQMQDVHFARPSIEDVMLAYVGR